LVYFSFASGFYWTIFNRGTDDKQSKLIIPSQSFTDTMGTVAKLRMSRILGQNFNSTHLFLPRALMSCRAKQFTRITVGISPNPVTCSIKQLLIWRDSKWWKIDVLSSLIIFIIWSHLSNLRWTNWEGSTLSGIFMISSLYVNLIFLKSDRSQTSFR